MKDLKENLELISLYHNTKLDLLQKYMVEWIEERTKVTNACFMDFRYNTFERWLSEKIKLQEQVRMQKAVELFNDDYSKGNVGN